MTEMQNAQRHVTETEAAEILGMKVSTLRDWRVRRTGPPWVKMNRAVRYSLRALEAYTEASTIQPE